jgi:hypothetical protein
MNVAGRVQFTQIEQPTRLASGDSINVPRRVRNQILPGSGGLVWRVNVMSNEDKIFTGGVN